MVIEKLSPKKGTMKIPLWDFYNGLPNFKYKDFQYTHEYWYDGRLFYIGKLKGEHHISMYEAETGGLAGGYVKTIKEVIQRFKESLKASGVSIHEIVRRYKSRYNLIDTWETSLLII